MLNQSSKLEVESDFIKACIKGDTESCLNLLLQDPTLINKQGQEGVYPLMYAASNGHDLLVEVLIKHGAELDAIVTIGEYQGATALFCAARYCKWNLVEKLIIYGSKCFDVPLIEGTDAGVTALSCAAFSKKWELVEKMMERGAKSFDATPTEGTARGATPLLYAANCQKWELVQSMIDRGAKSFDAAPTETSAHGITTMMYATYYQRWELVQSMIDRGAKSFDATTVDGPNRGKTALWLAAANRKWNLVQSMIERGAKSFDATPVDGPKRGQTALWFAAANKEWELVQRMIGCGAKSFDTTPTEGHNRCKTALWFAAIFGNHEVCQSLLSKGASIDILPADTKSLSEVVLLGKRSVQTPRGEHDNTLKLLEIFEQLFKIIETQNNANLAELFKIFPTTIINAKMKGITALQYAIQLNKSSLVEQLLCMGADIRLLKKDKLTAKNMIANPEIHSFVELDVIETSIQEFYMATLDTKNFNDPDQIRKKLLDIHTKSYNLLKNARGHYKRICSVLCYRLGKLLEDENILRFIDHKLLVRIYDAVKDESYAGFQEARAKFVHYELMSNPLKHQPEQNSIVMMSDVEGETSCSISNLSPSNFSNINHSKESNFGITDQTFEVKIAQEVLSFDDGDEIMSDIDNLTLASEVKIAQEALSLDDGDEIMSDIDNLTLLESSIQAGSQIDSRLLPVLFSKQFEIPPHDIISKVIAKSPDSEPKPSQILPVVFALLTSTFKSKNDVLRRNQIELKNKDEELKNIKEELRQLKENQMDTSSDTRKRKQLSEPEDGSIVNTEVIENNNEYPNKKMRMEME